jgi:hypothetical protein
MKQELRERLLGYVVLAVSFVIVSHFALNFLNSRNSLYESYGRYNGAVFVMMTVYLSSLLLFDVLLFFAESFEANRGMKRYWAVSCGLMLIWLIFRQPLMAIETGRNILATILIWLSTPFSPMLPVSYLFVFRDLA